MLVVWGLDIYWHEKTKKTISVASKKIVNYSNYWAKSPGIQTSQSLTSSEVKEMLVEPLARMVSLRSMLSTFSCSSANLIGFSNWVLMWLFMPPAIFKWYLTYVGFEPWSLKWQGCMQCTKYSESCNPLSCKLESDQGDGENARSFGTLLGRLIIHFVIYINIYFKLIY